MTEEDEEKYQMEEKSLIIFGRDISKIPCFRNSLLYGIGGGLVFGLGRFMFTSRPLHSCNFAVYSFSAITLVYWIQCRYKYSQTKFEMMQLQELMRRNALFEGAGEDVDKKPAKKTVVKTHDI